MKLTVKNFGPIKSAKVDIKPMTVFVGHSNTGKSYLAMLIYTISKVLGAPDEGATMAFFYRTFRGRNVIEGVIFDDKKFINFDKKLLLKFLEVIREQLQIEIIRCFSETLENLIKKGKIPTSIMISDDKGKRVFDLISPEKDKFLPLDSMLANILKQIRSDSQREDRPSDSIKNREFAYWLMREISNLFDFPLDTSQLVKWPGFMPKTIGSGIGIHYLPATRGGIMQSHRMLMIALVRNASAIGLIDIEIPSLGGVVADFLQKLLITSDAPFKFHHRVQMRRMQDISNLSKEIEQRILKGSIRMKMSETGYPEFLYKPNNDVQDIALLSSSSSVSELAPIVLFIRYHLSPNDTFIVEEPESNLHPEAQRLIAGILVELVNAGVRVIVTTHSDIILEQISNFIHADTIPQAKVLKRKAKGRTLSKEKTGVYFFKKRSSGTFVKPVKFDKEMGIVTDDHSDVSSDLYNETVDLFNARERARERNADDNI